MSLRTPAQIVQTACVAGNEKCGLSTARTLVLAIVGGAFVGFGSTLAMVVGKGSPALAAANPGLSQFLFGAVFPVGIIMIIVAGGELFTGNCGVVTPSCLSGTARWRELLRSWVVVYFGNFVGVLVVALVFVYGTGIIDNGGIVRGAAIEQGMAAYLGDQAALMAESKVAQGFGTLLIKGIACNWLVCLAVWLSIAADDLIGKFMGLWFPVAAFAAIGFEHSIANMYFIPMGMVNGAQVTIGQFLLNNLLPVTIGNIIGGAVLVGGLYWWVYGKPTGECS